MLSPLRRGGSSTTRERHGESTGPELSQKKKKGTRNAIIKVRQVTGETQTHEDPQMPVNDVRLTRLERIRVAQLRSETSKEPPHAGGSKSRAGDMRKRHLADKPTRSHGCR